MKRHIVGVTVLGFSILYLFIAAEMTDSFEFGVMVLLAAVAMAFVIGTAWMRTGPLHARHRHPHRHRRTASRVAS